MTAKPNQYLLSVVLLDFVAPGFMALTMREAYAAGHFLPSAPPVRRWSVRIAVNAVDAAWRAIDLTTRRPFGITVQNHITVAPPKAAAG